MPICDPSSRTILLAALAVHIPMLLSYFSTLWNYEHFQYYPFALLACVLLFRSRVDWQRISLTPLSIGLLVIDLSLLLCSCVVGSPWVAALGCSFCVAALAFSSIDARTRRRPWELGLLFLAVVRPPGGYDVQIVQKLQLITSRVASGILDQMEVLHTRSGNLIELSGKRLFVEEACSGVQSLFAIIFIALLVIAVQRRGPLHAFILLIVAPFCAIPMNIARIVTIAGAFDWYQVDLSSGTSHAVLGYALLGAAAILILSADRTIQFLSTPISDNWVGATSKSIDRNKLIQLWDKYWGTTSVAKVRSRALSRGPLLTSAVVAVLMCGWQCVSLFAASQPTIRVTQPIFSAVTLPEHFSEFALDKREVEERSRSANQGHFSERWRYRDGANEVVVASDYPFTGWHHLEVCYTGLGWQVESRDIQAGDWPSLIVRFSKPTGEQAVLLYSMFDASGEPLKPKSLDDPVATMTERFLRRGNWDRTAWTTYQVQLFHTSSSPVNDLADFQSIHEQSREAIRTHVKGSE